MTLLLFQIYRLVFGSCLNAQEDLERSADRRSQNIDDNGAYFVPLETPTFANGSTIANGPYRLLLRALRVTGDRAKQEDWETWLSPVVVVLV